MGARRRSWRSTIRMTSASFPSGSRGKVLFQHFDDIARRQQFESGLMR
jgi:hypothetical protein